MLTVLEIENFKGIASRQRIEFAPLTLLFGPNSAGKSTILQAVIYLHELLERGSADVDRTELGGEVVELGGFARLVHRHEMDRKMVLRAEFTTPGGLERFGRDLTDFPFPNLDDEVESAWLELTIHNKTTPSFNGPVIERVVIGVGETSDPLVELRMGLLREGGTLLAGINLGHPAVASELEVTDELGHPAAGGAREAIDEWEQIALSREFLELFNEVPDGATEDTANNLSAFSGWMPSDQRAWLVFGLSRSRFSALPPISDPLRIVKFNEPDDAEVQARLQERAVRQGYSDALKATLNRFHARERAESQVRTFLEMIVLGTTAQLLGSLRDALYIGPLRTVPPRGFLYERAGRVTSWADGLAAWDLLLADRLTLVERTNTWLERLGAGCKVVVQQLFDQGADAEELSEGHVDKTARRLLLDTGGGSFVLPSEVGAGISQVIPVVVAAIEGRGGLTLIEQPEIHVHPAMQVELGDLFIQAVTQGSTRRTVLVETHSEHLILRLLRRIRQTTAGELGPDDPPFNEDKLSVLYVEPASDGVRVRRLRVDPEGEFVDRWPKGFFAERMEELL